MGAHHVHVALGSRAYDIHIEPGSAAAAGTLIAPHLAAGKVLIVSDSTVAPLHAEPLAKRLRAIGREVHIHAIPAGEANKHITSMEAIWQACGACGLDRAGTIVAVGGGVVGDMAGFAAGTWMRGVRFIQVPTTLLAMVDSAVGGKTGCNSAAGKNLIGAFVQPAFVLIDPDMLTSMDQREFAAGLAEVLKYGVIEDPTFLSWQESNAAALVAREPAALAHAVAESCRIKAAFVVADEQEHGKRAFLNYGHTFGHALERETGYGTWLHGEAVGIGMRMAVACAEGLGMLNESDLSARQDALLQAWQLPLVHNGGDSAFHQRLMDACRLDKKARAGSVRFVLPRAAGSVEIVADPDPAAVAAGFARGLG